MTPATFEFGDQPDLRFGTVQLGDLYSTTVMDADGVVMKLRFRSLDDFGVLVDGLLGEQARLIAEASTPPELVDGF